MASEPSVAAAATDGTIFTVPDLPPPSAPHPHIFNSPFPPQVGFAYQPNTTPIGGSLQVPPMQFNQQVIDAPQTSAQTSQQLPTMEVKQEMPVPHLAMPSTSGLAQPYSSGSADAEIPSSPSVAPGSVRKRRFSSAKIQPTRIKKVMQSDEEIGRMVASVPVAIGRAMEHFAEKFLLAASAAVSALNGRTLGPVHMKMAVMANPHFHFLEPLLRDVNVHPKQVADIKQIGLNTFFTSSNGPLPSSSTQPATPTLPSPSAAGLTGQMLAHFPPNGGFDGAPPKPVERRRSSARDKVDPETGEKPRRGRPRKIKKEDKLIDDDLANVPTDRELMPPPAMLPVRFSNGFATASPIKSEAPPSSSIDVTASLRAMVQRSALQHQNSQEPAEEPKPPTLPLPNTTSTPTPAHSL